MVFTVETYPKELFTKEYLMQIQMYGRDILMYMQTFLSVIDKHKVDFITFIHFTEKNFEGSMNINYCHYCYDDDDDDDDVVVLTLL